MYPATTDAPKGKLRILYECMPMAYIMEQECIKFLKFNKSVSHLLKEVKPTTTTKCWNNTPFLCFIEY